MAMGMTLSGVINVGAILFIYRIIRGGEFHEGKGEYLDRPTQPDYVSYIVGTIKVERPLRVVIDPGNGATGPTAMEVYKALGCDVSGICLEPDGHFPNHLPNPLKAEFVQDLKFAWKLAA